MSTSFFILVVVPSICHHHHNLKRSINSYNSLAIIHLWNTSNVGLSVKITWSLTFVINLCAIFAQSLYNYIWVCNLFIVWWSSFPLFWLALPFSFPYKQSLLSPFSSFSSSFVIQLLLHLGKNICLFCPLLFTMAHLNMCCEEVISTTSCGTMMFKKGFVHVSFSWVHFLA
jgi:hypothetical protein